MRTFTRCFIFLILLYCSCKKPIHIGPKQPGVLFSLVVMTGYNDVRLTMNLQGIDPLDVHEMGVCYDEVNNQPTLDGPHFPLSVNWAADTTILDFQKGDTMFLRAYAKTNDTVYYSKTYGFNFHILKEIEMVSEKLGKFDITQIVAFEQVSETHFFTLIETVDKSYNYGVWALKFGIHDIAWRKEYKELKNQRPKGYAVLRDGYLIATTPAVATTPETFSITKLGFDGTIQWQKSFPVKYGNQFIGVAASGEYAFSLLSRGYDYNNITQEKDGSQIYQQLIDNNGVVQTSTPIPWPSQQPGFPQLESGALANAQKFLLVEPGTQAGTKRVYFYDQQQLQWSRDIATPSISTTLGFVSTSSQDMGYLLRSSDSTHQPLWFGLMDTKAGALRWHYEFSPRIPIPGLLDGSAYYSNTGDFYLTGYTGHAGQHRKYALYKLNANGQLQWKHVFANTGGDYGKIEVQRVVVDHRNRIHVISEWTYEEIAHLQLTEFIE